MEIYRGNSSCDIAYTVRGNMVCRGISSSDVAYTISGNYIKGLDGSIAYTIDGNQIYRGHTTELAYKIEGNQVIYGYSSYQVAYTIQQKSGYDRDESDRETVRETPREDSWEESREGDGHPFECFFYLIILWLIGGFFAPDILIAPIDKLFSMIGRLFSN